MSRVAKKPVDLPKGVTVTIGADAVTVKGAKGSLTLALKEGIKVVQLGDPPRSRDWIPGRRAERDRRLDPRPPGQHGHGRFDGL